MTTLESVAKFIRDHPEEARKLLETGEWSDWDIQCAWWAANGWPPFPGGSGPSDLIVLKSYLAATQHAGMNSDQESVRTNASGGKDPQDTSAADGLSEPKQPNTENMANPTVETRAFYDGEDLYQASPRRIIQVIASIQGEIKVLEDLGVSSTYVTKQVEEKKASIAALLEVLDSKA